jgi:hypothetical protein
MLINQTLDSGCIILYTNGNPTRLMTTPNWQHHSQKQQKIHLKPQALRQAKAQRQALKRQLDVIK